MRADEYDRWYATPRGQWIGQCEIGLLNRKSLLWLQKGRKGGRGAYRGARWHTVGEVRSLLQGFPIKNMRVRTAVHLHRGGKAAALFERIFPATLSTGAFILAAGEIGDIEAPARGLK
jgi:hypothetical protein